MSTRQFSKLLAVAVAAAKASTQYTNFDRTAYENFSAKELDNIALDLASRELKTLDALIELWEKSSVEVRSDVMDHLGDDVWIIDGL
jgi:hypothetical protein